MENKISLRNGETLLEYRVKYLFNAGYAGRDRQVVQHHIDELAAMGVAGPKRIPTIYPVGANLATTGRGIQVQHATTSGEVEFVMVVDRKDLYITIGSDHSDRLLEQTSVPWAKQAYPNIMAPEVWDYRELKDHWDDLFIRSWVAESGGEKKLYQESSVATLLSCEDLLDLAKELIGPDLDGLVLFSGTIPAKEGLICGCRYWLELEDRKSGRRILHDYTVTLLPPAIE